MFVPVSHGNHYVTRQKLDTLTLTAPGWQVVEPALAGETRLLRGNIGYLQLQPGLSVHFADTEELKGMTVENVCDPRLVLSIFLQGHISASFGGLPIPMPVYCAEKKAWQPVALLRWNAQPQPFRRQSRRGDRLRKIVITMTAGWLAKLAEASGTDLQALVNLSGQETDGQTVRETHLSGTDLAIRSWEPSAHSIAQAEQILSLPEGPEHVRRLALESRVLALISEAFSQLRTHGQEGPASRLRPHDHERLKAIDHFLNSHTGQTVSALDLAKGVGLSLNALRRLILTARGMSPGKYIRAFMLAYARQALEMDGVSIAEAAYLAGYSSPGNFTTAFKRHFNICPSALSKR